ncbi:MAG: hypothetical protein U1F60_01295 [Planctomycetota bacterium]
MHVRHALSAFAALAFLSAPVAVAQERAAPKKVLTFPEAVDAAKKAVDAEKLGAAIAALQAAIRDLQKKQRAAVLACLPKPVGWTVEDPVVDEQSADLAASMMVVGATVTRHYTKDEQSIHVEVTANSPLVQMFTVVMNNPALIEADGGELVKYGAHRAILKKSGETGQELTILMHDVHLIKVTAEGVSADDLLKVFDQACIDRLEKPLGK